jgi:hypothetical protein
VTLDESHHKNKHNIVAVGKHVWLIGQATNTMNIETEKIGGNSQVSSQRNWKTTGAAIASTQPWLWRHDATVQWTTTARRRSTLPTTKRPSIAPHLADAGVEGMPSNRQGGGDPAAGAEKKSRSHS